MELGFALSRRLEMAEACTVANWATEYIEIGGGIAAFAGPTSPVSHAIAVGFAGPVTEADIDRLEEFYRSRGAACNIDLCPLADPSLMERLGRRAYRITEFNNVLVGPIGSVQPPAGVRRAAPEEQLLWTRTMLSGFFERDEFTDEELSLGTSLFALPGAGAFLAEIDGVAAAAGAARVQGSLISMFGDGTVPRFRSAGLQSALIAARLAWAAAQGCDLATACTLPGTSSQRNYLRAGFQVAYTKMNMMRDF